MQAHFVCVIEDDMTTQEDLTAINTAISTILTSGQEVSTADGKSLKRADLKGLYEQKRILESEIAKTSTTKCFRTVAEY